MDKAIVVNFDFEKSTPGTHRFKEVSKADNSRPTIGTLYVTKAEMGDTAPSKISVTIEDIS